MSRREADRPHAQHASPGAVAPGNWPWLAVVGALTLLNAGLKAPGLDPPSLFTDDQWVGVVATRMSPADYLALRPPVPPGFALALAVLARALPDPEWALQLLPFLCSVAVVPFAAWTVFRLTGRPALSVLASAILAVDPVLSTFGLRAKPYASDCLLGVLLVLVATWVAASDDGRRRVVLAAASVLAAFFSFPAVFVGGALAVAFLVTSLRNDGPGRPLRGAVVGLLLLAAGFCLLYLLILRDASRPSLDEYWEARFLPVGSAGDALGFLADRGAAVLAGPFRPHLQWIAVLVPLGMVVLARERSTRWLAVAAAVLAVEVLGAAALRRYPVGNARTDLYAHGIVVLLACAALAPVLSRGGRWASVAAAAAILAIVLSSARPARYPQRRDAELVRRAHAAAGPGDGLVLYPAAGLAAGYYWPGEVRLRADPRGCGFNAEVAHPLAVTLETAPRGRRPVPRIAELAPVLDRRPARLVYLATNVSGRGDSLVQHALLAAGYRVERRERGPVAALVVFRRE